MRPPNPYNYNLPVAPAMFFGRDGDVETLVHGLTGPQGDSFALVGGRRMGKTSLLEVLERTLKPHSGRFLLVSVLLDMSGEAVDSVSAFFRTIAYQASEALTDDLGLRPDCSIEMDSTRPPARAFSRWLTVWNRVATEQEGRSLRLILLLDECEQIVERPWAPDLYAALRSLLVGRTTRYCFKVVLSGSHRFLSQVRQKGSPLRNVLKYHTLRVLDEQATRDLITHPTGGVLPEPVVQEVARQSGGHPFLTQYLMHYLWERGLEQATIAAVCRIAAGFPHERGDFGAWMEGLGDSGRRVYDLLLRSEGPLSEGEIRTRLSSPLPDLPQALEALCYHGLIVHEGDRYRVAGAMFRDWFRANFPSPLKPIPPDPFVHRRLQQLADNIQQDLELLKGYEDALRYEDNPRQKARYQREIEQLRKSAARYRQEYEELQAQTPGEPTPAMTDVADRLDQMDTKLDALLEGQEAIRGDLTDLRRAIFSRYEAGEQAIVAAMVERLDRFQLKTVAAVLEAIDAGVIPIRELEETLEAVRAALAALQTSEAGRPPEIEGVAEAVSAPHLDVRHRLKVVLPIIPSLLSYEGEIELGSGVDLEAVWDRLVQWVKSRSRP